MRTDLATWLRQRSVEGATTGPDVHLGGYMSSDNRDRKRSGLAGQIEVEITRDPYSTEDTPYISTSTNPLSILQELVEQAEELEHTTSEARLELLTQAQMKEQVALFHKRNSALKKMLNKLN